MGFDPAIGPMPLWESYVTFDPGAAPAPESRAVTVFLNPGVLDEDTDPFLPRDDEIMVRVLLISVGLSNIVVRNEPGP